MSKEMNPFKRSSEKTKPVFSSEADARAYALGRSIAKGNYDFDAVQDFLLNGTTSFDLVQEDEKDLITSDFIDVQTQQNEENQQINSISSDYSEEISGDASDMPDDGMGHSSFVAPVVPVVSSSLDSDVSSLQVESVVPSSDDFLKTIEALDLQEDVDVTEPDEKILEVFSQEKALMKSEGKREIEEKTELVLNESSLPIQKTLTYEAFGDPQEIFVPKFEEITESTNDRIEPSLQDEKQGVALEPSRLHESLQEHFQKKTKTNTLTQVDEVSNEKTVSEDVDEVTQEDIEKENQEVVQKSLFDRLKASADPIVLEVSQENLGADIHLGEESVNLDLSSEPKSVVSSVAPSVETNTSAQPLEPKGTHQNFSEVQVAPKVVKEDLQKNIKRVNSDFSAQVSRSKQKKASIRPSISSTPSFFQSLNQTMRESFSWFLAFFTQAPTDLGILAFVSKCRYAFIIPALLHIFLNPLERLFEVSRLVSSQYRGLWILESTQNFGSLYFLDLGRVCLDFIVLALAFTVYCRLIETKSPWFSPVNAAALSLIPRLLMLPFFFLFGVFSLQLALVFRYIGLSMQFIILFSLCEEFAILKQEESSPKTNFLRLNFWYFIAVCSVYILAHMLLYFLSM